MDANYNNVCVCIPNRMETKGLVRVAFVVFKCPSEFEEKRNKVADSWRSLVQSKNFWPGPAGSEEVVIYSKYRVPRRTPTTCIILQSHMVIKILSVCFLICKGKRLTVSRKEGERERIKKNACFYSLENRKLQHALVQPEPENI